MTMTLTPCNRNGSLVRVAPVPDTLHHQVWIDPGRWAVRSGGWKGRVWEQEEYRGGPWVARGWPPGGGRDALGH